MLSTPPDVVLRLFAAVVGVIVLALGTASMARRRAASTEPRIPVAGLFTVMSGIALLAEAWVLVGEFGLIGGVMLVFAGAASAVQDNGA